MESEVLGEQVLQERQVFKRFLKAEKDSADESGNFQWQSSTREPGFIFPAITLPVGLVAVH